MPTLNQTGIDCDGRRYVWAFWLIGHNGYQPCPNCGGPIPRKS